MKQLNTNIVDVELFVSCFMCLKSIEKYHDLTHLLLYTNTTKESELAQKYIDIILASNITNIQSNQIYNKSTHSGNCCNLDNQLQMFKDTQYGIISCVYIFGEGFNFPELNGVCIAKNMQSEIRIV